MFIAALFIIAPNWKQSRHPSISKLWYTHTMGHYSAIKRKVIKSRKDREEP